MAKILPGWPRKKATRRAAKKAARQAARKERENE